MDPTQTKQEVKQEVEVQAEVTPNAAPEERVLTAKEQAERAKVLAIAESAPTGGASKEEIAEMAAALAAAEEETKARIADAAPEALVAVASNEIVYLSLDTVDFTEPWNIRAEYGARVLRTYQRLLTDRVVRNPLIVAKMLGEPEDYRRGVAGFLRYRALRMIQSKNPDVWAQFFEGKVPFRVYIGDGRGIEETARQRLMLDHGTEEPLSQLEVFLAQENYMRQGRTESECCDLLAPLYYQLAKAGIKTSYDADSKRIADGEVVIRGSEKCRTMFALNKNVWRGRAQRFALAARACPEARALYVEMLQNGTPKFSDGEWREILSASPAELANILRAKQAGETLAAKPTEGKMWTKQQLTAAQETSKSTLFKTVYAAILGSEEAATRLPDLDDWAARKETEDATRA